MLEYVRLNMKDLEALDREKTIFLMAVSPIEIHGPHLPLGTDVFISEELQKRYVEELNSEFPDYTLVKLPSLYLGADALPVKGSFSIPPAVIKGALMAIAGELAGMGFHYLFLSDNHGGPRHQFAIESAARKAWKRYRFYMIDPFGLIFRLMVQHDKAFLKKTGLEPGRCGDDTDCHAGTNETSLMLATEPDLVSPGYADLPPSPPPPPNRIMLALSRLIGFLSPHLRRDLEHGANLLGWIKSRDMLPYMGIPGLASAGAGEAMLQAHVDVAIKLFRKALEGEPVQIRPILWPGSGLTT